MCEDRSVDTLRRRLTIQPDNTSTKRSSRAPQTVLLTRTESYPRLTLRLRLLPAAPRRRRASQRKPTRPRPLHLNQRRPTSRPSRQSPLMPRTQVEITTRTPPPQRHPRLQLPPPPRSEVDQRRMPRMVRMSRSRLLLRSRERPRSRRRLKRKLRRNLELRRAPRAMTKVTLKMTRLKPRRNLKSMMLDQCKHSCT